MRKVRSRFGSAAEALLFELSSRLRNNTTNLDYLQQLNALQAFLVPKLSDRIKRVGIVKHADQSAAAAEFVCRG
ncbi:hypothetical protein PFLUV_G00168080 [Perca fluviatilis]|uniref:Uncharacterized protein n=1 Tax=Perca fluviatilis TaxID=8168 RepID=A0A6A5DZF3_PERFL|nr:hypothetical protein PFLUV_G00168080 [Perca fluviatilis]